MPAISPAEGGQVEGRHSSPDLGGQARHLLVVAVEVAQQQQVEAGRHGQGDAEVMAQVGSHIDFIPGTRHAKEIQIQWQRRRGAGEVTITMQPKFSGSSLASLNHLPANGLQAATPTGKPIIPVNPTLNDRLVSAADIQFLIEGKETKLRMHPQAGITQDFFLLMAVCNTVIVAKHPHKDMMNASGMICNTSAIDKSEHQTNADSVSNCETESIATTVTAVSAPLQPEPTLTPKRSTRFFFTNPLSPIASSPETSPPASPAINRPKHLQLPSLWSKVMGRDGSSSKLNHSSRSPTPTPSEIRPIYEAESPGTNFS